ncbi:MAG: universal stress protein [Actinobacteria bacterium]|jgi:nucleotide-binding universal stress UspA family protein|nr:universal stress protein [Actinomycetota bacterium]
MSEKESSTVQREQERLLLAAIDGSAATTPVLLAASKLAPLLDATVQALNISPTSETEKALSTDSLPDAASSSRSESAAAIASSLHISLRNVEGDVADELSTAIGDPSVVAAVVGARRLESHRYQLGHITQELLAHATKPILVVWPQWTPSSDATWQKVLCPLDGNESTARSIRTTMTTIASRGAKIVAVHVFEPDTVPRFWDQHGHTQESWGREFLYRNCSVPGTTLQILAGPPGEKIVEAANGYQADMIVMCWAGSTEGGRAPVVTEVLYRTRIPVLLIPRIEDNSLSS